MEDLLLFLNQPLVLWSLFGGAIGLVLIDYLFPVDWPAYFGYALFGIFVGATVPLSAMMSLVAMVAVFCLMLVLHKLIFSRYLTNAPKHELARSERLSTVGGQEIGSVDSASTAPSANTEGAENVVR